MKNQNLKMIQKDLIDKIKYIYIKTFIYFKN